jgi:lipoprotein-anchoring transpeptidase ErfK/SrfK
MRLHRYLRPGARRALAAAAAACCLLLGALSPAGAAAPAAPAVAPTAPAVAPGAPAAPVAPPLPIAVGDALEPGEFLWLPEIAPAGPVVIVVSLPQQKAYVYRNGVRIAVSTVSTGKKGHETPTGVFTILQKKKDHRSNLYNDAPMPWMQRLTWDGIALHAGKLPGYPASHGCVRLPDEFAKRLFDVTDFGITVIIVDDAGAPAEVAHPGVFVPPAALAAGDAPAEPRLNWHEEYRWRPDLSPDGPLTVLLSAADRRVLVMRNGVEIGRARFDLVGEGPLGTQAYVLLDGRRAEASRVVPERRALNWMAIALPGNAPGAADTVLDASAAGRVRLPPKFAKAVYDALVPGASLVVTDAAVLPQTTGSALTVLTAGVPADEQAPPPE